MTIFIYSADIPVSDAETWSLVNVRVFLQEDRRFGCIWCLMRILNVHWSDFVTNDEFLLPLVSSKCLHVPFLARDSIYAIARYMPSPVRLSVRHTGGSVKDV